MAVNKKRIGSEKGFTLIELLVAILLTSLVLASVFSVFRLQTRSVKAQDDRQEAQEYARAALDMMVREIRNVGYNPLGATMGNRCAGGGVAGTPGIFAATQTDFGFTYDFQGGAGTPSPPDGHCDDPDEEIIYRFQAPGPQNCPAGFGDITRTANGATLPLTDCNVTAFTLKYYVKDSAVEMGLPIALANVQRVQINLTVQSKNTDPAFGGGQLNAQMVSNADLRNRGLP